MSVYSAAFLALNPGGYWRLGEPSGTNAADASTTNNAGTYGGSPTLGVAGGLVGDSDTAVTFDGVAQYVTIPNNAAYNVNLGNYSIAFRFKTTSRANSEIVNYSEGDTGFEAIWDGDHLTARVGAGGSAPVVSGGVNGLLADGLWHDAIISMLRSSNSGQWYVDGAPSGAAVDISSTASFVITGTGTLEIARRTSGLYFAGSVDEVGFFPAALTAGQALALYQAATLVVSVRGNYSAFPKFLLQRAA